LGIGMSSAWMHADELGADYFTAYSVGAYVFHSPSLRESPHAPVYFAGIEGWPRGTDHAHLRLCAGVAMTFWAVCPEVEAGWLAHGDKDGIYLTIRVGLGGWYDLGDQSRFSQSTTSE
jgi:hypothetical protein